MASHIKPTPKMVVTAVMTFMGRDTKPIRARSGSIKNRIVLKYRCPKPGCPNPEVTFLENTGFRNPYQHLRACFARGKPVIEQDEVIHALYQEAMEMATRRGGTIRAHFQINTLSDYEKALAAYVRWIVMRNRPLREIQDTEFRRISRHTVHISKETLEDVLFKLVELVEKRIAHEMNGTRGALLYDGWSSNGTHYIGVFASYCSQISATSNHCPTSIPVTRQTLISAAPMAQVLLQAENDDDEYSSSDEATKFNSETHLKFFGDILEFYGQKFNQWCVALISDNTSTNKRVSALSGIPMVGCCSHKLNLEVKEMIRHHADLSRTIDAVHDTMKAAKSKLKNAAVLRNLTDLRPIMNNVTRWSSTFEMLRRFGRIHDELIVASQNEESDIPIDCSVQFANKTVKYCSMLKEINHVTKRLQTRAYTLASCRADLDTLIEVVSQAKNNPMSPFYGCRLGEKYISNTSSIVADKYFEMGVVKIQMGKSIELTGREKSTAFAKKRKMENTGDEYVNCDFILGSIAEVERLWSVSKHILCVQRRGMTPQMFEALLFLKFNERLWDDQLVAQAFGESRSERVKARLEAHQMHDDAEL
eukprot:IDg23317t1